MVLFLVLSSALLFARSFLFRLANKLSQDYLRSFVKIASFPSLLWVFLISLYLTLRFYPPLATNRADLLGKVLISLLILSITIFSANLVSEFLRFYLSRTSLRFPQTGIIFAIVRFLIIVLGVITLLSFLGIPVIHFITTLGIAGLAISLALQGTLSNFFSGLNLIASRQIEVGDFVRLENGEEGFVQDITWMNTVIRRRDNNLVIVPNSRLISSIVIDYHKPSASMNLTIPMGVAYSSDLEKVERITVEVAKEVQKNVQGADPEFEPFIRYTSFGDFSINFNVVLRVIDPDAQFLVRHDFIKRVKEAYEREGIEIPFPIRRVLVEHEG